MTRLYGLLLCLFVIPVQAEVYKCTINGHTEFSDQPCSEQAKKIEIKITQPKQRAIDEQRAITATFEEESRVTEIHTLNQQNDHLEAEISRLERQRDADLEELSARTYMTEDGRMATTEHGLFQRMDEIEAQYQQQLEQIQHQIRKNKTVLQGLYRNAPMKQ
jgi:ubiquinone biosynthesis protein UbiJ